MAEIITFLLRSAGAAATKKGRRKGISLYERYQLPFFDVKRRSTWAIKPTGAYSADCETGCAYAIKFLRSNDGSLGWTTLLTQIVNDMIGAGPSGHWADGKAKTNGVVVGFMGTIGKALCASDTHALANALLELRSWDADGA
ncbi:MAG: hypothetical protein ABSF67_17245 [Roseiarcus sp.]|jgi:hypothetical protein